MKITRKGHTFTVDDNDLSGDWGFWQRFADGTWEPEVLDRMPDLVTGGTFLDIGAWIGPQTLWAAAHGPRVVAFEPDPTAYKILTNNVAELDVAVYPWAISDTTGQTTITTDGDSMSRTGTGTHIVDCYTVADVLEATNTDDVDLVKIDIEGAEQDVFPQASETLRQLDCPVFLSIHPWIERDPFRGVTGWDVERIAPHECLLWPN